MFTLVFEFDLRVVVSHRWAKLYKKPKIRGHPWKESLCRSLISLMCLKLFVTNPGKSKLFHHFSALLLPWFLEQFTQVIISKEIKRHYRITFSLSATIMKLLLSTFLHFCAQKVFPRYLTKFQSIMNIKTGGFWTFITKNLWPPLIFLIPNLGWEFEKVISFSPECLTG